MSNSWKDSLQICSFRDVKFLVNSHTATFGRRIIVNEFPNGEDPANKDLGKKARSFSLEGFIIANGYFKKSDPRYICGEDYFSHRDKIVKEAETAGSGVLVHPYLGRMQVNCQTVSVSESLNEGGMARLSFQFTESSDDLPPVVTADNIAKVTESTSGIKDASLINFKAIYQIYETTKSGIQKIKDAIFLVMDSVTEAQKFCADVAQLGHDLAQMVKQLNKAIEMIIAFPDMVSALFESAFGALSSAIDGFLSKNNDKRIMTAASVIVEISGSMSSPNRKNNNLLNKSDAANDAKRIDAWAKLANNKIDQKEILNTSAHEAIVEAKNRDIIELTTRAIALAYLADCIVSAQYLTSKDLNRSKDLIMKISDDIINHHLISDDMFSSILKMQVSVNNALEAIENKLPIIHSYKVTKQTNTLCFLYDNFGSLENESDLIIRNNIEDPSTIKADSNLMVAI